MVQWLPRKAVVGLWPAPSYSKASSDTQADYEKPSYELLGRVASYKKTCARFRDSVIRRQTKVSRPWKASFTRSYVALFPYQIKCSSNKRYQACGSVM